jgi:hypothetical protein
MVKSMPTSSSSSSGIGIFGLLGVLFVGLKLTHVINWSWWWVTAPFWGGFVIFLAFMVILLGIILVASLLD